MGEQITFPTQIPDSSMSLSRGISHNIESENRIKVGVFDQKECCICYEELNEKEEKAKTKQVVALLCDHVFHYQCIKIWMIKEANCPLCKAKYSEVPLFGFTLQGKKIVLLPKIHQLKRLAHS